LTHVLCIRKHNHTFLVRDWKCECDKENFYHLLLYCFYSKKNGCWNSSIYLRNLLRVN